MTLHTSIECVLFDLDGTLIDTAPDFVQVVNKLVTEHDRPIVDEGKIYQTVSDGARALVKLAFSIEETDAQFTQLNQRLLDLYLEQIKNTESMLYPGLNDLLTDLEQATIPWGIVTNKPALYAERLLDELNLTKRCGVLICPDHVENRKPHPEPILKACEALNAATEKTVYLGDHLRDIQSAKNADVIAIAAAYGYLNSDSKVEEWYADFIVQQSDQIKPLLNILNFA